MMEVKVIAVVVTYNRLELLKHGVDCLRKIKEISQITIVNNGSTDGTTQWLAEQNDLKIINQENVGGSGGFYTGIKQAYEDGADWVWCMDDDVFPREKSLAELIKHIDGENIGILVPRRLLEGSPFVHEFQAYDFTNPIGTMKKGKLAKMTITEPTEIVGADFEGPFISRKVIESIGLPNKDLFIFCDDTDYCLRAHKAGFKLKYIPDAILDKHKFFSQDTWSERNKKKRWKRFYQIRNVTYMNHQYGENIAVKYGRGLMTLCGYLVPALFLVPFSDIYSWKDLEKMVQSYNDGIHHRLGKM